MRERAAVWALAFGQMLGYACFFYIFAALILYWQQGLDWPHWVLAAGPTLAIAVSAVLAPVIGRRVDRGQAVVLLTAGPLVGAAALGVLVVWVAPVGYLLAWAGLGAAQAMCLYDVCFGLLVRRHGAAARATITQVTLVAGLASTLAFPAGAWIADHWGWQVAVRVAIFVAVGVMLPVQAWGARVVARGVPDEVSQRARRVIPWRAIVAERAFVRLAVLFALVNLNHWMLMNYLRPMFDGMGLAAGVAVAAAATVGPAQVIGRLVLMGAGGRMSSLWALWFTMAVVVAAPVFLWFSGGLHVLVFGFAALQGAGMGILTILRPVLVAERLGQERYGATAGLMAIPGLVASAVSAPLGAGLLAFGGPWLVIAMAFVIALGAVWAVASEG
ncbi:hypothetical protein [Paragemmobacter straminiformis]|uniref:MFS transporter n=1 Tax=Paragemmobacter straminiformis TaxID=2045119 RepID=A0A842IFK9_9RHOB|nr:hypothetical protein [Gemmobacter straminiformis]MBC2837408.1 hypothetical protein [Gemmobacter straminiformis]